MFQKKKKKTTGRICHIRLISKLNVIIYINIMATQLRSMHITISIHNAVTTSFQKSNLAARNQIKLAVPGSDDSGGWISSRCLSQRPCSAHRIEVKVQTHILISNFRTTFKAVTALTHGEAYLTKSKNKKEKQFLVTMFLKQIWFYSREQTLY